MELTLFKSSISVNFDENSKQEDRFLQEYFALNLNSKLTRFKKMAAKIEFSEGEELIFNLLLSLKNDILRLEAKIEQQNNLLELSYSSVICAIHYEYMRLADALLKENEIYYMRFSIEGQDIALFTKAVDDRTVKIVKFKNDDKILYDSFVAQMQREFLQDRKRKINE